MIVRNDGDVSESVKTELAEAFEALATEARSTRVDVLRASGGAARRITIIGKDGVAKAVTDHASLMQGLLRNEGVRAKVSGARAARALCAEVGCSLPVTTTVKGRPAFRCAGHAGFSSDLSGLLVEPGSPDDMAARAFDIARGERAEVAAGRRASVYFQSGVWRMRQWLTNGRRQVSTIRGSESWTKAQAVEYANREDSAPVKPMRKDPRFADWYVIWLEYSRFLGRGYVRDQNFRLQRWLIPALAEKRCSQVSNGDFTAVLEAMASTVSLGQAKSVWVSIRRLVADACYSPAKSIRVFKANPMRPVRLPAAWRRA